MKKNAGCRNHRAGWSTEEIRFVEKHFGTMPNDDIGKHLGRTSLAVKSMAQKLGCCGPAAPRWTEAERRVLWTHYAEGVDMKLVMSLLPGRSRVTIFAMADKLGIRRPGRWTPGELRILRKYYPAEGQQVARRLPGRSADAVKLKACELKLGYQRIWTESERALLKGHLHLTLSELMALFPTRSRSSIKGACERLKRESRNASS